MPCMPIPVEIVNTPSSSLDWLWSGLSAGIFAVIFTWIVAAYRERPRIKVCIGGYEDDCCYFKWDKDDSYESGYRIYVYVKISNLSFLPNSITEFFLKLKGNSKAFTSYIHFDVPLKYSFPREDGTQRDILIGKKLLKPIIDLEPFKTIDGIILFPYGLPKLDGKLKGKLIVKTTRKDITKKIHINPLSVIS